jgi:hypothetical protein
MAYSINKTDGSVLATVADGQTDNFSSDLTLIGKNFSGFGESLNENFIKLLENFSNTAPPSRPIRGQIWFDTTDLKLKVYSGTGFVPVSSATISNTQPLTLGAGDLWFNNVDKQLYFFDGTQTILLGPDFSESQGLSGLRVVSILDSLNQTRVITFLYTNGILIGIFSKDEFTPKLPIDGFTGNITPGFNAGSLEGIKFNVTATNAEQLGNQPATSYVRNDTSNIINGQLILSSNLGLIVGDANQAQLQVQDGDVIIANIASNRRMVLNVRRNILAERAIEIVSDTRSINFYPSIDDAPVPIFNMNGNLTVEGNLTVNGTTSTINTNTVTVQDKNIELASTDSPTDAFADGGGITLKGTTDHTFIWTQASEAWNSTENINLESSAGVPNPEFKINGVTVLSATSLGPGVTSIPGVTNFGTQIFVDIGSGVPPVVQMRLESNRISTVSNNDDLELQPDGTGNVALIGNPKITGLLTPTDPQDAATKEYVDNAVETRNVVLSLDISDGISNAGIATILSQIAPVAEYRIGTQARLLCTFIANSTTSLDINPLISTSTDLFNQPTGLAEAITSISVATATVSAPSVSLIRVVKTFQVSLVGGNKAWVFIS